MTIKLNKHVDALEATQEKIERKIDDLRLKMDAIEEKANNHDREMTDKELERYNGYEDQISDLNCEYDEIQNAIDYLMEYCE